MHCEAFRIPALERSLWQLCAEPRPPLQAVCCHAIEGGRRTRARLLLQASEREDHQALQAACALELLHAATLLQDDIFDQSVERRGRAAAHVCFGKAQTLLASDWLLIRALELAAEVHPAFFRSLAHAARLMAKTVGEELLPVSFPTLAAAEAHVAQIADGKTAALFAATLHAAALLQHRSDIEPLLWAKVGRQLGHVYQLLDDCLDLYAHPETVGKSTGMDLMAGRLTAPLLSALRFLESQDAMFSPARFTAAQRTSSELQAILAALSLPAVRSGVLDQVRQELRELQHEAKQAGIPAAATVSMLADMERKAQLCFSEGWQPPAEHLATTRNGGTEMASL